MRNVVKVVYARSLQQLSADYFIEKIAENHVFTLVFTHLCLLLNKQEQTFWTRFFHATIKQEIVIQSVHEVVGMHGGGSVIQCVI